MENLTWGKALDCYTDYLRAKESTYRTIQSRLGYLRRIRAIGQVEEITSEQVLAWVAKQDWKPETRHSCYCALRGFFQYLFQSGHLDYDPSQVLPKVKRFTPPPRPMPEELFKKALDDAPQRARLALELAGYVGLRRSEIPLVSTDDLVEDLLGISLIVHGKGGKDRLVPLPDFLATQIRIAAGGCKWAFLSQQTGTHISSAWLAKICAPYLPKGYSLHTLRHRFATVAYQRTGDIRSVQMLLGHEDLATTQRYIQVDAAALRRAMEAAI